MITSLACLMTPGIQFQKLGARAVHRRQYCQLFGSYIEAPSGGPDFLSGEAFPARRLAVLRAGILEPGR